MGDGDSSVPESAQKAALPGGSHQKALLGLSQGLFAGAQGCVCWWWGLGSSSGASDHSSSACLISLFRIPRPLLTGDRRDGDSSEKDQGMSGELASPLWGTWEHKGGLLYGASTAGHNTHSECLLPLEDLSAWHPHPAGQVLQRPLGTRKPSLRGFWLLLFSLPLCVCPESQAFPC